MSRRWLRRRARAYRFGGIPGVALLLLLVTGTYAAFGVTPFAQGHCACAHGPEVDCECPHHGAGDDSMPACHRKMRAQARAKAAEKPALRARCGSTGATLVLLALAAPERREAPHPEPTATPAPARPLLPPSDVFSSPPRQPPRAWT